LTQFRSGKEAFSPDRVGHGQDKVSSQAKRLCHCYSKDAFMEKAIDFWQLLEKAFFSG
jgi:hypothetical protein